MKKRTLKKQLLQYSALASAFSIMHADAQVVYTDIEPDIILDENDEEALLDMDNNGTFDFQFQNNSFTYYNYSFSSYRTAQNLLASPYISNNAIAGGTHHYDAPYGGGFTLQFPYAMEVTEKIGDSLSWHAENNQLIAWKTFANSGIYSDYCDYCYWFGELIPELLDHYFGIRFKDVAGENHYGWIRCDVKDEGRTLIIKDYAYEVQPDNPILAGDTVHYVDVSENENTLDAVVYSLEKNIYIQNKTQEPVQVLVSDLHGRKIAEQTIENGLKIISLQESGVYVVTISGKETIFSKKVIIH